jgi:hypothetical protein
MSSDAKCVVYLMEDAIEDLKLNMPKGMEFEAFISNILVYDPTWGDEKKKEIGYCVTLGGDGTILWGHK